MTRPQSDPPEVPDGVQRIWRLIRGNENMVGAIVEGVVPGVVAEGLPEPFVALQSYVRNGPYVPRKYPDGREFLVAQYEQESHRQAGRPCETLEEALHELEVCRTQLLAEGWSEIPFDVVNDPD